MRLTRIIIAGTMAVAACASPAPSIVPARPLMPASARPILPPTVLPDPTATPSPRPTSDPDHGVEFVPTPQATAVPRPMPSELPLRARREVDGIRVTIALERNPMPAGEPTWINLAVKNTGRDDVTWFSDGCQILVGVGGVMEGGWRQGLPQSGDNGQLKSYALGLGLSGRGPMRIPIYFTPEPFIGVGGFGCADLRIGDTIRPGETRKSRARWGGLVHPSLGMPPEGPIRLVASARYVHRTARGEPARLEDAVIDVPIDAWIWPGKPEGTLDAPEVIDIALGDPWFQAWFQTVDFASGVEEWVRYLPSTARWEVGALRWYEPTENEATLRYLVIHPETRAIEDRVERLWIDDLDPMP
jgi:hypothetical protein